MRGGFLVLINVIIYLWYWVFSTGYRLLMTDYRTLPWYKYIEGTGVYFSTVAVSVMICCFFVGLISASGDMYQRKSPESAVKSFFRVGLVAFLIGTAGSNVKLITDGIFAIGREMTDKAHSSGITGTQVNALFKASSISLLDHLSGKTTVYENLPKGSDFAFALKVQDALTKNLFTTIINIFPMMFELILVVIIAAICLVIIINIYGRLIKIALYTLVAPIPLATFSSHETSRVGRGFLRSYIGLCLEGGVVMLVLVIFGSMILSGVGDYSILGATPNDASVLKDTGKCMGWMFCFLIELVFQSVICLTLIKGSSVMIREMMGYGF